MKPTVKKHLRNASILLGVLIVGGVGGWVIRDHFMSMLLGQNSPAATLIRDSSSQYQYVDPLLLTGSGPKSTSLQFVDLSQKIQSYIASTSPDMNSSDVSVYYQDLNTGSWTGVNENGLYDPASMLKVTVLMAYLKEAQTDPSVFDQTYVYSGNDNDIEYFKPTEPLVQGQSYTVRDLLIAMIDQSDNVALRILQDNIPNSYISDVFDSLKLPLPPTDTATTSDYMSPKAVSRMFRVLYNGTYLYPENANQALSLLSQTTFDNGISAPIASTTEVAHKFGERTLKDPTTDATINLELHDCGIVYYPDSPYLLCVMTKGQDYPSLEKIIQGISSIVYIEEPNIAKSLETK